MGLFDFVKNAGEKIFGKEEDSQDHANDAMEAALGRRVTAAGLQAEGLEIEFKGGVALIKGKARSYADREKIVLAVGNSMGVSRVDDQMTVEMVQAVMAEAPEAAAATEAAPPAEAVSSVMYTVQSGDTLSKIAKEHYGKSSKYTVIFEANRPLLENPDKIYPGQVLRIPPLEK